MLATVFGLYYTTIYVSAAYVKPWNRKNKMFLNKSKEASIWSKFNAIMHIFSIKCVLSFSVCFSLIHITFFYYNLE